MKASVVWQGGMEFQGSADSGHTITLDAAPDVGGQDHGLRFHGRTFRMFFTAKRSGKRGMPAL